MHMKTDPVLLSRRSAIVGAAALLAAAGAQAQGFPTRPVKLIVPAPAGSSPDVIARQWGERFTRSTGQSVIIENRPGASTMIAAQAVANAPADGHTLLYTFNSTFSINPWVFKRLPYKAEDFTPVIRVLSVPYVLLVSSDSKIRTLQDLVREAKARPGMLTYASSGIASGFHVVTARLLNEAGISMNHVPYKDHFQPDLIAQRIDVAFDASTGAIPQIRSGKLRPIAVSSAQRIEALPDVPALAETFPGFAGDSWHGIFAPKGTPEPVLATLVAESQRIIAAPDLQAVLKGYALTPAGGTSEQFRQFLADDMRAWGKVVKDNNISVD